MLETHHHHHHVPHVPAVFAPEPTPGAAGSYTCPMHPEVISDRPGDCPICGMALEPVRPTATPEDNSELRSMTRRLIVSAILSVPLVVLAMGMLAPAWLELALAAPVATWAAWPFYRRFVASIVHRSLNMWTLIGLGVIVAFAFSLATTLVPSWFPPEVREHRYFETASAIITLVLLGQVLELRARSRTSSALEELLRLAPETARRIEADGREVDIPLAHVHTGDRLRVTPGTKVPVDGVIEDGHATLDEAMLTGEPMPIDKGPGDRVVGATLVKAGTLVMRAEAVGSATVLSRIVDLVATAQRSRAPIQKLADRVAGWFVPIVIAIAVVAFAAWAIAGQVEAGLWNAIAVLIIACPCALGLATPISIMVAVGRGARMGVLFRDAQAVERLREVDTLFVDKTGTLTEGRPALVAIVTASGVDETDLLRLAAAVERGSEHPLALAITSAAEERGLRIPRATDWSSTVGQGVTARAEGKLVAIGNFTHMDTRDIDIAALHRPAEEQRALGRTVMYVAIDRSAAGIVAVADPIKASTPSALAALTAAEVRVAMVTGDNRRTAHAVADELGIAEVHAEIAPADKIAIVERAQHEGHVVAMAGDGINDAPALARADVGIAMGSGTDVAIESAAITLVRGDLGAIARAVTLSKQTMRNIKQNLFFAFVYNAIGIPLAALGLLSPMFAAFAMSLSSVSVIGNALRLRTARS